MSPIKRSFLFFLLGLLCIVETSTNCSAEETTAMREVPTVQLNIFQSSQSITAPIDGEIALTNLTNKAYDIQSVSLHLPQGLAAIRPDFSGAVREQLHGIGGKDERIYSFGIPRVSMSFGDAILNSDTLFFVPGKYRLQAEIVLKESGNDKGTRSLYAATDIPLEPPLSAPLRGGIVGAFLLALFVPAYRILRAHSGNPIGPSHFLKYFIGQFVIYSISGSVVAVTTILFIHRMGSANLPISVSVNDYLGGIIIGLLSYVFGDMLYKKFFDTASHDK